MPIRRWTSLLSLGLLAGMGVVACGPVATPVGPATEANTSPDSATAGLAVPDVYDQMEQSMTRPGRIFYTSARVSQEAGPLSYEGIFELWADPQQGRAHQVTELHTEDGGTSREEAVLVGGLIYASPHRGRSPSPYEPTLCPEAGAIVSLATACWRFDQAGKTTVAPVQVEGVAALELTTEVAWSGSDESFEATRKLYLDAASFLPIAVVFDGTVDYGETAPLRSRWAYENSFVPSDSLPADFFDPVSVGYVGPRSQPNPVPTDIPAKRPLEAPAATTTPAAQGLSLTCSPQAMEVPCAAGVETGKPYHYTPYTHCGIRWAYFDGRWWKASPPLDDGNKPGLGGSPRIPA